jgi:hypothetical protein
MALTDFRNSGKTKKRFQGNRLKQFLNILETTKQKIKKTISSPTESTGLIFRSLKYIFNIW